MTTPRSIQRAIVCVAADRYALDRAAECCAMCERHGYQIVGVVVGVDRYPTLVEMALRGDIDVVVVPSRTILPADRPARLESVTQEFLAADIAAQAVPSHRRKPRRRTRFSRRVAGA